MRNAMLPSDQASTIDIRVMPNMPPLGWLITLAGPRPSLLCGADVETFRDGFFEGCWAGEFDGGAFHTARHVFGSGGKIEGDRALFITPSHTLDAVYALRKGGTFTVANSLAFLVQFADLALPFDFGIGARFVSVAKGIDVYERVVFQTRDWTLYRIVYDNFEIRDGELRTIAKLPQQESDFDDYTSYLDSLLGTLRRLVRNGSAPGRKAQYSLITCCSSGYDSTVGAALAVRLGCRQALTLRTSRGGRPDSGRSSAEAMGLEVIELERPARARGNAYEEAEFFATGMGGEDFVFVEFGPHCGRKILFTGFHGGALWDRKGKAANISLTRRDVSGSNLTELRLRHGFIHVPVAFIGATRHDVLLKISSSAEMEHYRVGGDYDKPVARRIAEEQGVRRGTFAMVKNAASINLGYLSIFWSPHTFEDLKRFERRVLAERGVATSACYYLYGTARTGSLLCLYAAVKLGLPKARAKSLLSSLFGLNLDTLNCNHPRYSNMAFLWAVDKIRSRYPSAQTCSKRGEENVLPNDADPEFDRQPSNARSVLG
jgi:hypothetical protein